MKRKSIRKRSPRGQLRKDLGALQFKILKLQRGDLDELTGQPPNGLGRFHIIEVSISPRLEFEPENILLVNWFPHHNWWHHYGPGSDKNDWTCKRISELRGTDWKERLKKIGQYKDKHTDSYLRLLLIRFTQELKELTK